MGEVFKVKKEKVTLTILKKLSNLQGINTGGRVKQDGKTFKISAIQSVKAKGDQVLITMRVTEV